MTRGSAGASPSLLGYMARGSGQAADVIVKILRGLLGGYFLQVCVSSFHDGTYIESLWNM
jgi:hypothetical protein